MGMDELAEGIVKSAGRRESRQNPREHKCLRGEKELAKEPQKDWPKAGDPGERGVMEAQGGSLKKEELLQRDQE